jgi:hypothetical protein
MESPGHTPSEQPFEYAETPLCNTSQNLSERIGIQQDGLLYDVKRQGCIRGLSSVVEREGTVCLAQRFELV